MSAKGFTLIELLIAITIIGVLAAIGFVAYSSVLKSGRDSKRQSDLRSIQSALEQYHNDQGNYPTSLASLTTPKAYLNQIPEDPLRSAYGYQQVSSAYCVYANLENTPPSKPASCTNASYNFALTPP